MSNLSWNYKCSLLSSENLIPKFELWNAYCMRNAAHTNLGN